MAGAFSEFYSGGMLAPNRVNGTLVPAQIYGGPSSVADMYKGIYAETPPAQPAAPSVSQLFDISNDPTQPVSGGYQSNSWANPAPHQSAAPHVAATTNGVNPLDVSHLGLTNDPFRPQTSAQQAITKAAPSIADLFAGAVASGVARRSIGGLDFSGPSNVIGAPDLSGGDTFATSRVGPAPARRPGMVSAAAAAVAPAPAGFNISSLFGGGQTQTHAQQVAQAEAAAQGQTGGSFNYDQYVHDTFGGDRSQWGSH